MESPLTSSWTWISSEPGVPSKNGWRLDNWKSWTGNGRIFNYLHYLKSSYLFLHVNAAVFFINWMLPKFFNHPQKGSQDFRSLSPVLYNIQQPITRKALPLLWVGEVAVRWVKLGRPLFMKGFSVVWAAQSWHSTRDMPRHATTISRFS